MQVENRNNYNGLGRMGPIYPRPEYHPPRADDQEQLGQAKDKPGRTESQKKGDRAELSQAGKNKTQPGSKARIRNEEAPSGGRLNLASAKELTQETSQAIAALPPWSTTQNPHRADSHLGLLYPTYV
jgi:hypothetical protein